MTDEAVSAHPFDCGDFVAKISFRFVGPNTPVPRLLLSLLRRLDAVGCSFEFVNTQVPPEEQYLKERIRGIFTVRKQSTLAVALIINKIVSRLRDHEAFVNIGVLHGFTLFAGMVGNRDKRCVGVDNSERVAAPGGPFMKRFHRLRSECQEFHAVSYEEYFDRVHRGPIGFYVYDADHGYEHQLRNLLLAERFFSDRCLVMIDDANAPQARQATQDFLSRSTDRYETLLDVRTPSDRHLTFWNGTLLLRKRG